MSNILFDTSLIAIDALGDNDADTTHSPMFYPPTTADIHPNIPEPLTETFEIKSKTEQAPSAYTDKTSDEDISITYRPARSPRGKRNARTTSNSPPQKRHRKGKMAHVPPSLQHVNTPPTKTEIVKITRPQKKDLVGIEAFKYVDAITPIPTPMSNIPPSSFGNNRLVVRKFRSSMLAGLKRTIILGAPGGGKSHTLRHFMYRLRKFYASVLVINPSESSNMMYSHCIPSLYVHNIFDTKICNRLINRQSMAVASSVKNPTALFILDDCTENIATLCSPGMRILWLRGRHLGNAMGNSIGACSSISHYGGQPVRDTTAAFLSVVRVVRCYHLVFQRQGPQGGF